MSGAGIYIKTPSGLVAAATVPGKQGSQGPQSSLTAGPVTTGAAGTSAAATITGAGPVQTLNLTIPRGNTGDPTAFELRGTGSPEGVVTAPVGTYYTDTALTNGAMRWAKKTGTGNTGWKVTEGDTGWRSLIDGSRQLLNNISGWRIDVGGANRSLLHIRRINEMVHINLWELYPPAGSTTYWGTTQPRQGGITSLSHGFRGFSTAGWSTQACLASWNSAAYQSQNVLGTIYPVYGNTHLDGWPDMNVLTVGQPSGATTANWQVSGYMIYRTNDNWPTTLPGTAA